MWEALTSDGTFRIKSSSFWWEFAILHRLSLFANLTFENRIENLCVWDERCRWTAKISTKIFFYKIKGLITLDLTCEIIFCCLHFAQLNLITQQFLIIFSRHQQAKKSLNFFLCRVSQSLIINLIYVMDYGVIARISLIFL